MAGARSNSSSVTDRRLAHSVLLPGAAVGASRPGPQSALSFAAGCGSTRASCRVPLPDSAAFALRVLTAGHPIAEAQEPTRPANGADFRRWGAADCRRASRFAGLAAAVAPQAHGSSQIPRGDSSRSSLGRVGAGGVGSAGRRRRSSSCPEPPSARTSPAHAPQSALSCAAARVAPGSRVAARRRGVRAWTDPEVVTVALEALAPAPAAAFVVQAGTFRNPDNARLMRQALERTYGTASIVRRPNTPGLLFVSRGRRAYRIGGSNTRFPDPSGAQGIRRSVRRPAGRCGCSGLGLIRQEVMGGHVLGQVT